MNTREKDENAKKDNFEGDELWQNNQEESHIAKGYDPSDESDYDSDSDDINERTWEEDEDEDIEGEDEDDEEDY